jgi:predicted DNA-binding protein (MmcQ/YjbR family)
MTKKRSPTDALLKDLREFGLAYPGAHTKSPWPGHLDLAVNDKTFAYLSTDDEPFGISCKLPSSCTAALMLPFVEPTPYGLGKSGWVSAKFAANDALPPIELFQSWIDESYRAQAPKKLVKSLPHAPGSLPPPLKQKAAEKKPAKQKPAKKKPAKQKPAKKKARTRA